MYQRSGPRVYLDVSVFRHQLDDLASFGLSTIAVESVPPPAREADAYQTADVRVGWSPRPGLQLAVNGRDLLDADHVEFGHAPPPNVGIPHSVYASITWTAR